MTLLQALARPPDDTLAIRDGSGAHPWSSIRRRAARIAGNLRARGVAAGDRIGMLVSPGAGWLSAFMGIVQAEAVAVPLSHRYPDRELAGLLEDAGARLLVVTSDLRRGELPCTQIDLEELLRHDTEPFVKKELSGNQALMLYTSGTTARPKGVMLSHRALGHQIARLVDAWKLGRDTRLLHSLPLHHMHGIAIALLPTLAAGGSAIMLPRFEARAVWEALGDATTFMGVPTMYHRLVAELDDTDPETAARWKGSAAALTLAVSGSAALPATLAKAWRRITGTIPLERYGMTESGVIASNPFEPAGRREGTVGLLMPGLEMRLRERDGTGGKLQIRGEGLFSGYWQRPEATAEASSGGWFDTGDVAQVDGDGRIRLLGRSSVDILKSGGTKISALEIEEALREHPQIEDLAVVGLPDDDLGQRIVAALVAKTAPVPSDEALRAFAAERMAAYKIPRRFVWLDSLPRNALGKVTKPALVTLLTGG